MDLRRKNIAWNLPENGLEWQHVQVAVLMDIRDELKTLNSVIGCRNTIDIPNILRRIDANTKKRKYKKRGAAK